jgi:GNAT superfamily N-acetyltransferase
MNYTVKVLAPEDAEIFTEYFSQLDFNHAPDWGSCYCRYYHKKMSNEQWFARSSEENRAEAYDEIKAGNMKGLLAFDGEKCIGWCNANNIKEFVHYQEELQPYCKDKKVGSIICFVVHPDYRRQGVARLLLNSALEEFHKQSFDAILTLTTDSKESTATCYGGTMNMYLENGFAQIGKLDGLCLMWKDL